MDMKNIKNQPLYTDIDLTLSNISINDILYGAGKYTDSDRPTGGFPPIYVCNEDNARTNANTNINSSISSKTDRPNKKSKDIPLKTNLSADTSSKFVSISAILANRKKLKVLTKNTK